MPRCLAVISVSDLTSRSRVFRCVCLQLHTKASLFVIASLIPPSSSAFRPPPLLLGRSLRTTSFSFVWPSTPDSDRIRYGKETSVVVVVAAAAPAGGQQFFSEEPSANERQEGRQKQTLYEEKWEEHRKGKANDRGYPFTFGTGTSHSFSTNTRWHIWYILYIQTEEHCGSYPTQLPHSLHVMEPFLLM